MMLVEPLEQSGQEEAMGNVGIRGFGSVNNAFSVSMAAPEVGMAATVLSWSDRHPATVVYVSPSGKLCRVRECTAKRTDENGMSECQSYEYSEDENGRVHEFRLSKRGWREAGTRGKGAGLMLGRREKYHDFSF